ncbi:hypothetical protein GCM10011613_37120 [Cellvibrio zantedeschiae]|uniref:non-specific serine/threonine protein kinase n=1 Tax=Cellvibrio zantedeschiae TaxID=1237077 RepID=A0ABQ3BBM1_9GAMM|nr:hypothetical protein GCM10011613_37120 [Cellvibrio zantedeschiae]
MGATSFDLNYGATKISNVTSPYSLPAAMNDYQTTEFNLEGSKGDQVWPNQISSKPTSIGLSNYMDNSGCVIQGKEVLCWGDAALNAPSNAFVNPQMVSVGWGYACVLDAVSPVSKVVCWSAMDVAREIPGLNNPSKISVAVDGACSMSGDGKRCWDSLGQTPTLLSAAYLLDKGCIKTATGSVSCVDSLAVPGASLASNPKSLTVGGVDDSSFVCAITASSLLDCRKASDADASVIQYPNGSFTQVSAGFNHACALGESGVKCWGNNDAGQTTVPSLNAPIQVVAGKNRTCALDSTGVVCWGAQFTQPGFSVGSPVALGFKGDHLCVATSTAVNCLDGTNDQTNKTSMIKTLSGATQLAVNNLGFCAANSANILGCWGFDLTALQMPASVGAPKYLAMGTIDSGFSCAASSSNWSCKGDVDLSKTPADNIGTILGLSSSNDNVCALVNGPNPVVCSGGSVVPPVSNIFSSPKAIAVGASKTCVSDAWSVRCWGEDGPVSMEGSIVSVTNAKSLVIGDLNGGDFQVCALNDTKATCWNSVLQQSFEIPFINATAIAAGRSNTCALDQGQMVCWGDAFNGRYGWRSIAR